MATSDRESDSSPGFSENFVSLNRNKPSVALDLKHADDVARLKLLVAVADIVVKNYQPSVLPKLGLGYDNLHAPHQSYHLSRMERFC